MEMTKELKKALETIFSADSELYKGRGFQRRIGYGKRPALINVDLANAWTREGNAFTCDGMDVIIPATQKLLKAARAKNCPVVFTCTAYVATEGPNTDMGLWHYKIPVEVLKVGDEWCQIDDRIKRRGLSSLRFYDGLTHRGMFSLPLYIRRALTAQQKIITDAEPIYLYNG